jgi:hypothetical protein
VHFTEKEPETKPKVEIKVEEKTASEPLKTFKPTPAHRRPQPGPLASHFAGFPGNGAPHSSSNPNWPRNPHMGWGPGSHNGIMRDMQINPNQPRPHPEKGKEQHYLRNGYIQGRETKAKGKVGKETPQPVQWPLSK